MDKFPSNTVLVKDEEGSVEFKALDTEVLESEKTDGKVDIDKEKAETNSARESGKKFAIEMKEEFYQFINTKPRPFKTAFVEGFVTEVKNFKF